MIDFPTLFPSLVKYIPNWMERFYPRMAQFARGEGYPCGNKGVFIPRRNKCWTHPKTGNRLTKPLTYQKYQEAKEKSQKSRTEKGRTALANREQSFRDKAREKAKGWQNKIAGGKSVDQQYKDIIASSKNPKGTEDAMSSALKNGVSDFDRENYNRYLSAIKSGTADKGVVGYYQDQIDRYKPVIDAENFINERRKKAISGDYETEQEAGVYVLNKLKQKGYKEHEYYDSPDYEKDYGKLMGVMKSAKLPPPLSGIVPGKELKQTLTPGDKLLVKENTYSVMGGSSPTGYRIVDGGEVLKVNVKNVKTRVRGEYMGKPYENEPSLALDKVTHVIRDGKRYKVDDSDSSPNDLGIIEKAKPKTGSTGVKGAGGKSETQQKSIESGINTDIETGRELSDTFVKRAEKDGFKRSQVSIYRNRKSEKPLMLDAMVKGAVAVHPEHSDGWRNFKDPKYAVTHVPTGMSISNLIRKTDTRNYTAKKSEDDMMKLADSLQSLDLRDKDVSQEKMIEVVKKVREVINPPDKVTDSKAKKRVKKNEVPYTNPLNYRDDPLDKFDKTLDKEVEKLQQKTKTIPIETLKGKVDGLVSDYGNGLAVWKNKDNKKKEDVYTVVHTPSGKRLTTYDSIEEDQSKRIVAGLTALGVDWTKEEKEFTKDERLKDLNGLMRRVLDSNYRRFKIADKERLDKLRKARDDQDKKNDFNSNLKLAQFGGNNLRILKSKLANFAKPGCCCDASKPLKRRKTKQTPRLKRRGNRYA